MNNQTIATDLASIKDAETRLRQAVESSIDELGPKITILARQIEETRNHIAELLTNPVPASDFPNFIAAYVDKLSEVGAKELATYLSGELANVRDGGRFADAANSRPLAYRYIERLVTGANLEELVGMHLPQSDVPKSLLPKNDGGGISEAVLAFLFGDQLKEKLRSLLAETPVSYGSGLVRIGSDMASRRVAFAEAKDRLAELTRNHETCVAQMAQLQAKKRAFH